MTPDEIESLIRGHLAGMDSSLTIEDVRKAMAECRRETEEDNVVHGLDRFKPFWNYVSDDSVSVFAIFTGQTVTFYFIRRPLSDLTPLTNRIPMGDVAAVERLMAEHLGKREPDFSMDRGSAEYWMN